MVKHGDLGVSDVETVGAITGRIGSDYATRRCGVCVRDGYWRACGYDRCANRMLHNLPAASVLGAQSIGVECDDHRGGLWFVRFQAGLVCIAPAGNFDDPCGNLSFVGASGRFHNIEAAVVEKARMFPKDLAQVGNCWMIIRQHLSVELTEGLFNPCGCKSHLTYSFLLGQAQTQKAPPAIARTGPPTQAGGT